MIQTTSRVIIDRPPEAIFAFVVDGFLDNYPRWSPEVKTLRPLSEGPLAPGWKARQVRVDQGRRTATDFVVTELQRPQKVAFRGVTDPYGIEFRLDPQSDIRTELIFSFELGQLGMAFRPFEKLIRHAVQGGVERVTRNLKTLVERETRPAND